MISGHSASEQDAMTRAEMLETMKHLDAHAYAMLLTYASDIDLLGGMIDVMPDTAMKSIRTLIASPPASLCRHVLQRRRRDRGLLDPRPALSYSPPWHTVSDASQVQHVRCP